MAKIQTFTRAFLALVAALSLTSCGTSMPVAQHGGLSNVGYIVVASAKDNVNQQVAVSVNGGESTFEAKAVKQKQSHEKGTAYQLSSGKKAVKITKGNEVLYDGIIILNQQETKIILIP